MTEISIIVPVYDEASTLAFSLSRLVKTLDGALLKFELIVVCDGCTDDSAAIAKEFSDSRIHVIELAENTGKGSAIMTGITYARGEFVGWFDADLDIDPVVIATCCELIKCGDIDGALGSKRHRHSHVEYPPVRRFLSWGFQTLTKLLFGLSVRDSQVGAKVFRREVLDDICPALLVKRYAFDLEVLAVSRSIGHKRFLEVPVTIDLQFRLSSISSMDVARMFVDVAAIWYRLRVLRYYDAKLASRSLS